MSMTVSRWLSVASPSGNAGTRGATGSNGRAAVMTALGDIVVAAAAFWICGRLGGAPFAPDDATAILRAVALLSGILLILGFYRVDLRRSYERFRLRALAVMLFVLAQLIAGPLVEDAFGTAARVIAAGVLFLIFGFWCEQWLMRGMAGADAEKPAAASRALAGGERPGSRSMPVYACIKRASDIALGLLMLIASAPVVALAALLIKRADPGPAFYAQTRIGAHGRAIAVLKLRTMYRDADARLQDLLESDPEARAEWNRFFKLRHDPRVLPRIGHILRRTSIDELPQLWNVIRGSMSLVGPRPFPAYHMQAFDQAFQQIRTSVPPGLTGLWQISERSEGDLHTQRLHDLSYIARRSLLFDLYILLATVPAVALGRGAR